MTEKVVNLLNDQINKEFYSAYLYLDFANYYASVGLDGFENWYRVQAQEERDHAMLFYHCLLYTSCKLPPRERGSLTAHVLFFIGTSKHDT